MPLFKQCKAIWIVQAVKSVLTVHSAGLLPHLMLILSTLYIQNTRSNVKNVAPNPGQSSNRIPSFFTQLYCLYMRHFDVACCNETNKQKCLTTKIDVCNAHKGYKTEKDALMKENSAKASKMCILPFTQLLPLPLSNEREACLPALLRGSELLWGDSMPLHIDGDKQSEMAYKFSQGAINMENIEAIFWASKPTIFASLFYKTSGCYHSTMDSETLLKWRTMIVHRAFFLTSLPWSDL